MKNQKLITLILSLSITILFTACINGNSNERVTSAPSEQTAETSFFYIESILNEESSDYASNTAADKTDLSDISSETTQEIKEDNHSQWSVAQITDYYKNAAYKSNKKVKSEQIITLKDFSINNGQYENVIDFVIPLISKFIANSSTEKDGITGGFTNLAASDVHSARAYKCGNNTVIEMVMVNQTDGAKGDMLGGSVGHAISVIGDITQVTNQLSNYGLPEIRISDKDTKINYTNATVKTVISPEGEIINGTWEYTVEINMNNYKVGNSTVENTSVVMDNVITVNGGFAK